MSWAGHAADMVSRWKQNREILTSKRAKFKEDLREGLYSQPKGKPITQKPIPEKELKIIKRQIRTESKAKRKRLMLFKAIFLLFAVIFLIWFFIYIH